MTTSIPLRWSVILCLCIFCQLNETTEAGQTWDGGPDPATDNKWSTPDNWNDDTLPNFGSTIVFTGKKNTITLNDLGADTNIGGFSFTDVTSGGDFTLNGDRIVLLGNITGLTVDASNSRTETFNLDIVLGSASSISFSGGSRRTLEFHGIISANGTYGSNNLVLSSAGLIVLSNENTFTGNVLIRGGNGNNFQINSLGNAGVKSALGAGSIIRFGDSGNSFGRLTYDGSSPAASNRTVQLDGTSTNAYGMIQNDSTNPLHTLTFTGGVFVNNGGTTAGTRGFRLGGTNTGANLFAYVIGDRPAPNADVITSFTKDGPGHWMLTGDNTFTGDTTVAGGNLTVPSISDVSPNALGLGSTLRLGGITSTTTTVTGTLIYSSSGSLPTTTNREIHLPATASGGGTILNNSPNPAASLTLTGVFSSAGTSTTVKALTLGGSNTGANEFAGDIVNGDGSKVTRFQKDGSGSWTLTGTNTYTGTTIVNDGLLRIDAAGSIANTSLVTITGGTFRYDGATQLDRNVTVNGGRFAHNSEHNYIGVLTWTAGTLTGNNWSGNNLVVSSGRILAPGNSTGTMTAGETTWANSGTFEFEINDAEGVAGSALLGWDLFQPTNLNITAGTGMFTIHLISLNAMQAPGLADFDATSDYSWLFVDAGATITGFDADKFILDPTPYFQNPHLGTFSITHDGGSKLFIEYAGVIPEPSKMILITFGLVGLVLRRRRSIH